MAVVVGPSPPLDDHNAHIVDQLLPNDAYIYKEEETDEDNDHPSTLVMREDWNHWREHEREVADNRKLELVEGFNLVSFKALELLNIPNVHRHS